MDDLEATKIQLQAANELEAETKETVAKRDEEIASLKDLMADLLIKLDATKVSQAASKSGKKENVDPIRENESIDESLILHRKLAQINVILHQINI